MMILDDLADAVRIGNELANELRNGQRRSCYLVQRKHRIGLIYSLKPSGSNAKAIMMKIEPESIKHEKTQKVKG